MKARLSIILGIIVLGSLVAVAYYRSGLLSLPEVPNEVYAGVAGLQGIDEMKIYDDDLIGITPPAADPYQTGETSPVRSDFDSAKSALDEIRNGEEEEGFTALEEIVRRNPASLVLGNALRMEALRLKRKWLVTNADKSEIALVFPDYLRDEPIHFFRELVKTNPSREVKLQLASSLVDHMLLFPALEIKAPSSVEAVEILTGILKDRENQYYVPALYARGLNYLYRPFNLVWPERIAAPADAASTDIAMAVAVGQKIGAGSDRLKAELSLALGDAYAKEGKLGLARSWWQIANNMAREDAFRQRVFTRLHWSDDDVSANLEEVFDHQMNDLDHPLSDLRIMWR
ncbi:MAG TPA: hypothetical protein VL633_12905 [Bacteroidota bacterium]|jgi:hypothetical protein|nr:hypothetical protein [Bacteroidota bacterium]